MKAIARVGIAIFMWFIALFIIMFIPAFAQHTMELLMGAYYLAPLFGLLFFCTDISIHQEWRKGDKKEKIIPILLLSIWLLTNIAIIANTLI